MKRRAKPKVTSIAVAYVRCSTSRQDLSPAAQMTAIERWAERECVTLVAVYLDIGISGGASIGERPGLAAALASLPLHSATIFVAAKLDRLSRDTYVMGSIDREARRAQARVVTADGATDDELRRDIDVVLAAHERRLIRRRTKDALAVKRARGERVGAVPYGMQLASDGVHLVSNENEQRVIARIHELDTSLSLRAICAQLARDGVVGRTGKPLSSTQVYRILR